MNMFDDSFGVLDKLHKSDSSIEKVCLMSTYFSKCDKIMGVCDSDANLYNLYMKLYKSIKDERFEDSIVLRDNIKRYIESKQY